MKSTKIKTVLLSLMIFFNGGQAAAKGMTPTECGPDCTCYRRADIDTLAKTLEEAEVCFLALERYQRFAEENNTEAKNLEMWQEPSMIVGGLVVTASVFALLGYTVAVSL